MDTNTITLIGTLLREPALDTSLGMFETTFLLANRRARRDEKTRLREEAIERHLVIATGRLAEVVKEYVHKHDRVQVEGRLDERGVLCEQLILLSKSNEGRP